MKLPFWKARSAETAGPRGGGRCAGRLGRLRSHNWDTGRCSSPGVLPSGENARAATAGECFASVRIGRRLQDRTGLFDCHVPDLHRAVAQAKGEVVARRGKAPHPLTAGSGDSSWMRSGRLYRFQPGLPLLSAARAIHLLSAKRWSSAI